MGLSDGAALTVMITDLFWPYSLYGSVVPTVICQEMLLGGHLFDVESA